MFSRDLNFCEALEFFSVSFWEIWALGKQFEYRRIDSMIT